MRSRPVTVRAALHLALASPRVQLSVIDAQLFPGLAERFGVRSVPLTVLDDGVTLVGELRPLELHPAHRGLEVGHAEVVAQLEHLG